MSYMFFFIFIFNKKNQKKVNGERKKCRYDFIKKLIEVKELRKEEKWNDKK